MTTDFFVLTSSRVDIDECLEGSSDCQQVCINTAGNYSCSCRSGYELDDNDGKSCLGTFCSFVYIPVGDPLVVSRYKRMRTRRRLPADL